jgi:hypothetical protein
MSIRHVLRAVTRPSAESGDLSSSEDQTRRALALGGHRIAAMSLKGLRYMHSDEFPANTILGNSGARRAKEEGQGFSVGASVFLLYDSPLREEVHEGGESAGDNRSSGCKHPHRHLAQASWLVVAPTYPASPKISPFPIAAR